MNRIIIDEYEKELENITGILELNQLKHCIHLKGQNKIHNIKLPENSELIIELEDHAQLEINVSEIHQIRHGNIIVNSHNETKLFLRMYIEVEENLILNLTNNIIGNKNKSNIEVHIVSDKGTCLVKTLGLIKEKTEENEFLEELKGLCLKEPSITFLPELIVDSDFVIANHNATIKCLDEEELFYLKSKGLDEENATTLIKNGFLNKAKEEEVDYES